MPQEPDARLAFLTAALAEGHRAGPFVVIIRTRDEFIRWSRDPGPGPEWLQVEDLLGDSEVWAFAAQGEANLPLDVILANPAAEFSSLYRLVDVRAVRDVRVTMPAAPGFLKALRLAASLQLPVRLLPGQPSAAALGELDAALDFYLHDPVVEAPVEFFHSTLAAMAGNETGSLWTILEEDPAVFARCEPDGCAPLPRDFVTTHLAALIGEGAECAACRWQARCAGYFKQPIPGYDCVGVKQLFASIESAADEIRREVLEREGAAP